MVIASFVFSAVALALAGVSALSAFRSSRNSGRAAAAAERSASAAEKQLAFVERDRSKPRPTPWRFEVARGRTIFDLHNDDAEFTALDVSVTPSSSTAAVDLPSGRIDVHPRSSVQLTVRGGHGSNRAVTVKWRWTEDGDVVEWVGVLPGTPPARAWAAI